MGYAGSILGILTSLVVFALYGLQRERQVQPEVSVTDNSSALLTEQNFEEAKLIWARTSLKLILRQSRHLKSLRFTINVNTFSFKCKA